MKFNRKLNLIAALDMNEGIGKDNKLAWRIRKEINYFKEKTIGSVIIMGRNTWESIPKKFRPLPDRINIVISCRKSEPESSEYRFTSIVDSLNFLKTNYLNKLVYVIGGEMIYSKVLEMDLIKHMYITKINKDYGCDIHFPMINQNKWKLKYIGTEEEDGVYMQFYRYSRRSDDEGENQYLGLINKIIDEGEFCIERTGTGTISYFGTKMEYDLMNGRLPILTTKRMPFKMILKELLWFISGDTNAKTLQEQNIHIWDGNSSREYLDKIGLTEREEGDLGPVYGFQWRHYGAEYKDCKSDYKGQGIDQLEEMIRKVKEEPNSRRIFMTAWNPKDLKEMVLPPCHLSLQLNVGFVGNEARYLDSCLYQRSGDFGLGVPFNITSYSILTHMIANLTGLKARKFVHMIGDTHIYHDHVKELKIQEMRTPSSFPIIKIQKKEKIDEYKIEDFEIEGYYTHPGIKLKMSV